MCQAAVRPRLCKVYFLRIAAVSTADGESRLSTHPVDGPMHAAPDIKDCFGLGAAIRRVSHEQQLWAVLDGHPAGQPMIAAIDLMAAKSPFFRMLRFNQIAAKQTKPTLELTE